jgi:hypothetical protein
MNLRYLEKNGEKVLQGNYSDVGRADHDDFWRDVPTVKEEKSVVITKSGFEKMWLDIVGTTYDKDRENLVKELFREKKDKCDGETLCNHFA